MNSREKQNLFRKEWALTAHLMAQRGSIQVLWGLTLRQLGWVGSERGAL